MRAIKLSDTALKRLEERSKAEGISPSELVLKLVQPPKATDTTKRTRARKALGQLSNKISARAKLSEKEVMERLKK